jgi:hypothetical protein
MARYTLRIRACMATLLLYPTASLAAQSTHDAPRTLIGVSIGLLGGGNVWDIANQVITPISVPVDTTHPFTPDIDHLKRDMLSHMPTVSVHVTHFVNTHVGYTGEFNYLGFKTSDACTVTQRGTDPLLGRVCDSIPASSQGARTTTVFQGGLILRPLSSSVLQPYFEGMAGIASTPSSTGTLTSTYGHDPDGDALIVNIYQDPKWGSVQPTWTLAAGLATMAASGLQVHVEVRDSWIAQSIVTGATMGQGAVTPVQMTFKGWLSVMFGFDIVLAKSRGKRY